MGGYRILGGGMTLQAAAVGGSAKLAAVRLVAMAAGDAGREHLALLERAVVVDLVQHLPVGVIETLAHWRYQVRLGQPSARSPCFGGLAAASVTKTAGLDLSPQGPWRAAATALPVAGLIAQVASRRSVKRSANPIVGSSGFRNGHQLCRSRAQ